MRFKTIWFATALCLGLAACGTNPTDRAISGGGIGAAGGAVIAAVAGGPVLGIALLGGAAGAAAGALINGDKFNLGNPPWHQN